MLCRCLYHMPSAARHHFAATHVFIIARVQVDVAVYMLVMPSHIYWGATTVHSTPLCMAYLVTAAIRSVVTCTAPLPTALARCRAHERLPFLHSTMLREAESLQHDDSDKPLAACCGVGGAPKLTPYEFHMLVECMWQSSTLLRPGASVSHSLLD